MQSDWRVITIFLSFASSRLLLSVRCTLNAEYNERDTCGIQMSKPEFEQSESETEVYSYSRHVGRKKKEKKKGGGAAGISAPACAHGALALLLVNARILAGWAIGELPRKVSDFYLYLA